MCSAASLSAASGACALSVCRQDGGCGVPNEVEHHVSDIVGGTGSAQILTEEFVSAALRFAGNHSHPPALVTSVVIVCLVIVIVTLSTAIFMIIKSIKLSF
jgi:hypothetical protein